MKSRYDMMRASEQTDGHGNYYPDVLTLDIKDKTFSSGLKQVRLTQTYKKAFYMLCYDTYADCSLDDLLMWLNGISEMDIMSVGDVVLVPTKDDLDNYYTERLVSR